MLSYKHNVATLHLVILIVNIFIKKLFFYKTLIAAIYLVTPSVIPI